MSTHLFHFSKKSRDEWRLASTHMTYHRHQLTWLNVEVDAGVEEKIFWMHNMQQTDRQTDRQTDSSFATTSGDAHLAEPEYKCTQVLGLVQAWPLMKPGQELAGAPAILTIVGVNNWCPHGPPIGHDHNQCTSLPPLQDQVPILQMGGLVGQGQI